MPSKTAKQRRAMQAACRGRGRLQIPKKVACEFVAADKRKAAKKKRGKRKRSR